MTLRGLQTIKIVIHSAPDNVYISLQHYEAVELTP